MRNKISKFLMFTFLAIASQSQGSQDPYKPIALKPVTSSRGGHMGSQDVRNFPPERSHPSPYYTGYSAAPDPYAASDARHTYIPYGYDDGAYSRQDGTYKQTDPSPAGYHTDPGAAYGYGADISYDPYTGMVYDPYTGMLYDPYTGYSASASPSDTYTTLDPFEQEEMNLSSFGESIYMTGASLNILQNGAPGKQYDELENTLRAQRKKENIWLFWAMHYIVGQNPGLSLTHKLSLIDGLNLLTGSLCPLTSDTAYYAQKKFIKTIATGTSYFFKTSRRKSTYLAEGLYLSQFLRTPEMDYYDFIQRWTCNTESPFIVKGSEAVGDILFNVMAGHKKDLPVWLKPYF